MTQDGNQRIGGNGVAPNWMFTKYDKLGRVVYTGLFTSPLSRKQLQQQHLDTQTASNVYETRIKTGFTNGGKAIRYSNTNFPSNLNNMTVLSVSYYDDATQVAGSNTTYDTDVILSNNLAYTNVYSPILSTSNTGLPTISETRVLGTNDWITSASYYDIKARAVYGAMVNDYLGTWDKSWSNIDFIGKATETKTEHHKQSLSQTITTTDYLTYDHMDRLTTHVQMIGSQPLERVVNNTYDAMGQLESKGVGGTTTASQSLQTVDYNYNVRGWLTNINDQNNLGNDLFGFDINYNAPALGSGSEALYNGNISETLWKTANDGITRGYQYGYDALNRIKYATYRGGTQHQASGMLENYSVNNVNYDKNGNITTLNRKGLFENASNSTMSMDYVDKLTYQYSPKSNQLINVRDIADVAANNTFNGGFKDKYSGINYIYGDANGNMTQDNNKNIQSISYNHLNLPTQIEFTGDRTIVYTYDASGVKLKKEIFLTVRDLFNPVADLTSIYAGNYIYEKDSSGEKLSFFSHPEGYIEKNGTDYDYVYQYKDHLGTVRLSYSDTNNNGSVTSAEIREENNYYPFGLKHKGYNNVITGRDHKYGFGGKEEQGELGLEWHDFHARNYDASLGRWMNLDNLSEMYYNHSPFNYTTNNPIYFIDPDGNKIIDNDGIVSKQKSQIASDQNDVNLMVSNGALDTEVAKKINNFYNSVLKEITDLEDSKQVYRVSYDSNFSGNEGETSYDWINHDVAVKFSKSASFGTVGHELKHAYQFETGNVGFTRNGQSPLYDITDETEGYNRELDLERTISQFSPVNPLSPIKGNKRDFTDQDIIDKGKTFTVPAYQNLPSSSISINSKTGRKLRKMAKESGLNDTPVNNVYIGWQKDYNKGVKKRK
ncbi:hypothetical protein F0365_12485 [Nonlabens sp. Ci31]|uniref:RHS repeat domain-containing protein n=1 Tax=Nonlabens sp. Ci31 TaxID=2608253 RepID=UPI0014647533|nr:RHS repeat-associated core domain-containing protein [Nonlabens sp. Ci31]QJP35146.1 hypothetical protein F0365_12485 [Nonlabens sp. Ci31]